VVIDDSEYDSDVGVWQREFDQKNAVFRGIDDCSDDDFVIVSDVDEIVNPDAIKHAIEKS
jgi:beta-1,4-mannosyl-glycoprotein beta-1,4-N-acetylglucosaminyltransferase